MWYQKKFWIRLINAVVIVLALLYYNQITSYRQEISEANKKIDRLVESQVQEKQNGAKDGKQEKSQEASKGKYKDGKYSGSAKGYGGNISLTVTIEGGEIADIKVNDASGEDAAYYNNALSMIDAMIEKQTHDVPTVSGATYSSNGLKNAVKQALRKAAK